MIIAYVNCLRMSSLLSIWLRLNWGWACLIWFVHLIQSVCCRGFVHTVWYAVRARSSHDPQAANSSKLDPIFLLITFSCFVQLAHNLVFAFTEYKKPFPFLPDPKYKCPEDSYGPQCACFEDDTLYYGYNVGPYNVGEGVENPQPSRHACQQSCQHHPSCKYWTWRKSEPTGTCYLKTKRENVLTHLTSHVSGNKLCKLPEGIYTSS